MPPIVGASAGSLTALMLLTGVDFDRAVEVALTKAEEKDVFTKASGLRGELTGLLRDWMKAVLPEDIPTTVLEQLSIALTPPPTNPFKSEPPTLETGFTSRGMLSRLVLPAAIFHGFRTGIPWRPIVAWNI